MKNKLINFVFFFCFMFINNTATAESPVWSIGEQENVAVYLIERSLEDSQEAQIYDFKGVVEFASKEEKKFRFYKYIITIINNTDHSLKCLLFIDEGVPLCAIIKSLEGWGSWGIHHSLPHNRDATVVIDDTWEVASYQKDERH